MIRALVLLFSTACVFAQDAAPVVRRTPPQSSNTHKFSIRAIAPDNETKLVMLRWGRRLTDKLQERMGVRAITPRSTLWIIVREDQGEPDAASWQSMAFGEVQQKVAIRHIENVERDVADAALCRAVLFTWMNMRWDGPASGSRFHHWVEKTVPSRVPDWLCRALARGLHPKLRAEDSLRVSETFNAGNLYSLETFLKKVPADTRQSLEEAQILEAMGTELLEWLLSFDGPAPRFDSMVATLASGSGLTTRWLARVVPGAETQADVQALWETWIRGYEHRILIPGNTRDVDMERLHELTQLTKDSGLSMPDGRPVTTFRELARITRNPSLDGFVVARTHELRVLALGRSTAFANVIEYYCQFLAALRQGTQVENPHELLSQAEKKHASLRRDMKK